MVNVLYITISAARVKGDLVRKVRWAPDPNDGNLFLALKCVHDDTGHDSRFLIFHARRRRCSTCSTPSLLQRQL